MSESPILSSAPRSLPTSFPVVLFDGGCGLCHRGVRFILKRERAPELRFASLDSEYATAQFERLLPDVAPPDSMAVIDGDRVLFKSAAALFVAARLRAPWSWIRACRIIPPAFLDRSYDFIAIRRHHFQKPADACPVTRGEVRKRFRS